MPFTPRLEFLSTHILVLTILVPDPLSIDFLSVIKLILPNKNTL